MNERSLHLFLGSVDQPCWMGLYQELYTFTRGGYTEGDVKRQDESNSIGRREEADENDAITDTEVLHATPTPQHDMTMARSIEGGDGADEDETALASIPSMVS